MSKIKTCCVCNKDEIGELIDFGGQSVSHNFLKDSGEKEHIYNLALGQCGACGTLQLTDRAPIKELKPRYDWLTCTEPEDHLDRLVTTISQLPGITKDSRVGGISFKDDSTLDRLKRLGFNNTWRADIHSELGITDPIVGFQSVQESFNSKSVERMIKNHGKADVFIARHIIEHAYDFREIIESSKKMINPGGYLIFEIPDCQQALEKYDYMTIWEEHTIYFTGETFRNFFNFNGLSLVHFERIPYSIEDSYVGIAKIDETLNSSVLGENVLKEEILLGERFAAEYQNKKNKLKEFFTDYQQNQGKVALFGAGHMSCAFLNLLGLKDLFEFVVDDNPNMRGLFMPGSRLPIFESKIIYDENIKLCILTLSETSEGKVIRNNKRFLEKGGTFLSVFPGSKLVMEV